MKVARGKSITFNDLKHLVHPVENGTIPDTRYRPCQFPGNGVLPRILLMNGSGETIAKWFSRYGFSFLEPILVKLSAGKKEEALALAQSLDDSDEKAVLRRITFAFPAGRLVSKRLLESLQKHTCASATTEQETLAAWYKARDAEL